MEKRAILFLVLSIIILLFYPVILEKWFGIEQEASVQREEKVVEEKKQEKNKETGDDIPIFEDKEILFKEVERQDVEEGERDITVETDLIKVVLNSRGGNIKRWELKRYKDHIGTEGQNIQLLNTQGEIFPLNLSVAEEDYGDKIFQTTGESLNLTGRKNQETISFYYKDPVRGDEIQKEFTFHQDSYRVDVRVKQRGNGEKAILSLGENFGITDWGRQEFVGFVGPISLVDGKVEKDKIDKIEGKAQHFGRTRWTALQDKYFISALLPRGEIETRVVTQKLGEERVTVALELPEKTMELTLYAGPKEHERLKALNAHLDEAIDFGWFIYGSWSLVRLVAKPLFSILNFFYQYSHNYGFSIILLTILIKVLFIPLTHKSYTSMKAMQGIQPQMQALQKKYKNDKERLNKEMLSLYKTNKVNPLGGCLPIFLQIPVFIALFNILYTTIELRQAPFILWITDLSDKDPFYVLPIIMGATMFIQQKIQPTPMDPRQAKIMLFLPLIFTFLFLNFSSGLVLYWMTNNILTIAQQYITVRFTKRS